MDTVRDVRIEPAANGFILTIEGTKKAEGTQISMTHYEKRVAHDLPMLQTMLGELFAQKKEA